MRAFLGKMRKKKRCFQPFALARRDGLARGAHGKASASLRGMSEAAISNAKHEESAASDMKLATPWQGQKDLVSAVASVGAFAFATQRCPLDTRAPRHAVLER